MRIEGKFNQLRKEKRKAFIAYVPFGFPKISCTRDILYALQDAGVDLIELGMPFSDPLADGPIIQKASSIALGEGANPKKLFEVLEKATSFLKVPLLIMTYYNPLFRFGIDKFFKKMKQLGISGIMVVDLPFEESAQYLKKANRYDLETVFFITPTTSFERAKKIVKISKGFIYYISVRGITGPKDLPLSSLATQLRLLKKTTNLSRLCKGRGLPICVGFGIHKPDQVRKVNCFSDGAIVGSSLVKFIEDNYRKKNFLDILRKYIKHLKGN